MGATLELQRLQHVERLEQQMMWAQLAQQASPHAPQVYMYICCCCYYLVVEAFSVCLFSLNEASVDSH